MEIFYALVALCFCGSALAQVPSRGACPQVKLQPYFNARRWLGKWYEQERYFAMFELESSCNTYTYSLSKNGTIRVISTLVSGRTGEQQTLARNLPVPDEKQPERMLVQIPLMPADAISNFWILGTDYNSYCVVYSCTEYGELNLQFAWIITRKQNPDSSVLTNAYRVIDRNRLSRRLFWKTNKNECNEKYDD